MADRYINNTHAKEVNYGKCQKVINAMEKILIKAQEIRSASSKQFAIFKQGV